VILKKKYKEYLQDSDKHIYIHTHKIKYALENTQAEKCLAMYAYKQVERKYTRCMEIENEMENSKPERRYGTKSNGSEGNKVRSKCLISTVSTLCFPDPSV
jgi:hypothetical protein